MRYDTYFKPFPVFTTRRLTLRMLRPGDARDIFSFCRDPEISRYAEWYPHKSLADSMSYISNVLRSYRKKACFTWAVCENRSGRVIGTCSYIFIDPCYKTSEIGYCFSREYWGNGYATEAASVLLQFGFHEIGFQRIQARLMAENVRSERVLQRLGMQYEGLMKKAIYCKGVSHDLKLYAITDDSFHGLYFGLE